MIDIKNTPIHQLPMSPSQEMLDSKMNLYDYRKPAHYYQSMPGFEELRNIINNGDYTLRDLIYNVCRNGHIYYILEGHNTVSPYALAWIAGSADLTERGEKKFKKLLDSEVIIHEQGFLFIRYSNKKVMEEFLYGVIGCSSEHGLFVWH